ncbi:hypothetical protein WHR41_04755 [Cladosporium halotolerans]|uniref:DUF7371 domain-containing protein n=1 Tax=Cladosporium halotolerans TaxID=1052096 RepID=A0AB34KLM0_9PEZI
MKLTTILATMPFGMVAALTASGSLVYYGNSSAQTATAINPVTAQCNTSTVYYPVFVTETYTTSIFVSPTACTTASGDIFPAATDSGGLPTVTHTSTSTSTYFKTTTLTVLAVTSTEPPKSTSSSLPFIFEVTSGTTRWINGVSPSSGASLTTATTTVLVPPSSLLTPSPASTTTLGTSQSHTTTLTSQGGVSTSTSYVSPDLTITTHITRTSTVTALTTTTRSSFGGMGSAGWNTTDSVDPSQASTTSHPTHEAVPTTATVSFFWASSGGHTYSTSTRVITTTLYRPIPVTSSSFMPSESSLLGTGSESVTTSVVESGITSLPSLPSSNLSTNGNFSILPITPSGSGQVSPATASAITSIGSAPSHGLTQLPSSMEGQRSASVLTATNATVIPPVNSPATSLQSTPTASFGNLTMTSTRPQTSVSEPSVTANSTAVTPATQSPSSSLASSGIVNPTTQTTPFLSINTSGGSIVSTSHLTNQTSSLPKVSGSASASLTSTSSATPSTQLLSSIGTSLANGQGPRPKSPTTPSSSSNSAPTGSTSSSTTFSTSKTSASASTSPSACGEHGDFVLDFDDLPSFSGDKDITQAPPIFSPYHHLTFSSGYVYAPQDKQPFAPHSANQLAVFLASGNGTNDTTWHQNGMSANVPRSEPGEITDGPYDGLSAFWFNARGAWLGCDNNGPEPCVFNVTGWTWNSQIGDEVATYNTQIEVPACSTSSGCKLQHVNFPDSFRGLSGIQIQAFANGKPRMFFMDDLELGWYDNSCAAGMQRMGRPGSFGGPGRSGGGRKRVVRRSLMR